MRHTSITHRTLRLALIAAMLCPNPAFARVVPDINLGTIRVLVRPRLDACTPGNGSVFYQAPSEPFKPASPGIDPSPSFHSGNTDLSVWGLGWTSDIDHRITINANRTITWTNGQGVHVSYFQTAGSSTTPVYTPPVNAYETITTVSASSGVPRSLLERDTDGTTRRFDVFESTSILRLALLTDRNGNTVAYTRDALGRLTRVQDVHGRFFNLTYNPAGLVATLADSGGRSSSYAYDAAGRRTGDTGPLGSTGYLYDGSNRMVKITYPNGGVKNYAYDAQNRVLSEDDGAGVNAQTYVYYNSSTTVADALGRVVKYDYITLKGLKKISKMTDPSGGVTAFVYDGNLNLLSTTDPLGRVTTYTYDAKGNVTSTADPAGGRTLASYEPNFNLVASLTDPLARTTNMTYDAQGNLTVVTDALSGKVNKGYDSQGHVISSLDPLGHRTAFSYEPTNGALKTITDPLTRQTVMLTDGLSRVTRNTDPSGKVTEYTYDAASNLTQVTDAMGGITRYAYAPGRDKKLLQTVTDAKGHTTTFGYDAQGRLTSVTNALGQTKTSTYDGKGNLISTKNARNQTISYEYNSRDLLTKKITPEGNIIYAYDAAGNLISVAHYNGSSTQNRYDALNRVTQQLQTLPNGFSAAIGYVYDAAGNRTNMSTPWGNFGYFYDANNRLTRITNPHGRQFNFSYDATGRRSQLDFPNGVRTSYNYDDAGQLLSIAAKRTRDNVIISSQVYTYDQAGNRTNITDREGVHSYGYDTLHRLTRSSHPNTTILPIRSETFNYDAVGNRLADAQFTNYTYDEANRLTQNSGFTYGYDADGNLISMTARNTNQTTMYYYDSENRLVGAGLPNGQSWMYKYDGTVIPRRVEKSSGTAAGQTLRYIYDGPNMLAVLDASNNVVRIFTMGLRIDEPLLVREASGSEYSYQQDGGANVSALINSSGTLVESYSYQGFGLPQVQEINGAAGPVSTVANTIMFAAREFDEETGFSFNRARYLEPSSGRFLSEDVLQNANRYAYAENNPINTTDPTGLVPRKMVPEWLIDNAKQAVNNITGNAFTPLELAILTDMVIHTINGINPFATATLADALRLGNLDPDSNPLVMSQKQKQAIDNIFKSIKAEKGLTKDQMNLVKRAEEAYHRAWEVGACKLADGRPSKQ